MKSTQIITTTKHNRLVFRKALFLMVGIGLFFLWPSAQTISEMDIMNTEDPTPLQSSSKMTSLTTLSEGCIIVVGAFERKENADRKVRYLAKKGLTDLYRGMHNGKEYLGVPIDCDTPNIDSYLQDFQYRYIADAWVFTLPSRS